MLVRWIEAKYTGYRARRMTVYTRRGDEGETDLWGGDRVSKAHPRIEAGGAVDELNALIGIVRPSGHADVDAHLDRVQNHLHILQADLARPDDSAESPRIDSNQIELLESWIDECEETIEPLESFILPGGSSSGGRLHHARTVCRRAERRVVALENAIGESGPVSAYLNRLSDLLFVLARVVNDREGVTESSPTY